MPGRTKSDAAARDTEAAINAASGYLPSNLPRKPTYRKINPADAPIMLLSITSDIVPRPQLYDIASSIFAQKLSQVAGVGQVSVGGSSLPAVRVEVNPQPVSDYNVGLDEIGTFLARANAISPKGSIENNQITQSLLATDQLFEAKDYKDLVVVYWNGPPVRLLDLGRVVDGTEDVRNTGLSRGRPSVMIQVNRQPNANIIDTVDRIKALLPQFRASLPSAVRLDVDNDRTTTISFNLVEGYSLSDAVQAIERAEVNMGMPAGITGQFAGTARAFQDSLSSQPILILTALLAVYIVLGMLYESLIHPLTIISTLPSAGLGALIALVLFRTELSIIALIGIILLIGIVKKNAIMMIDFALAAERNEGLSPRDAIFQACLLRFSFSGGPRPMQITSSTRSAGPAAALARAESSANKSTSAASSLRTNSRLLTRISV